MATVIAETVADPNRPDLRRNGIGDGNHAFEIALPDPVQSRANDLVVVARNGSGSEQPLRVPQPDEQAAEALIAAPLAKVLDKLDVLMASQRQLQVSQRSLQRAPEIDADKTGTRPDRRRERRRKALGGYRPAAERSRCPSDAAGWGGGGNGEEPDCVAEACRTAS